MKILLVNAFVNEDPAATHGRGRTGWAVFERAINESLGRIAKIPGCEMYATSKPIVQTVRATELQAANLLCDFENCLADIGEKNSCLNFDNVDVIFVGGDSST